MSIETLLNNSAAPPRRVYKGNLLLVDDDPDLLRLLAIRLNASGYTVSTATSGTQALSMVAAERPDLVVTDLRMAGLDGMALFPEIDGRESGLPVIILTAHGTIPDAVAATRQGVFGYITKPYDGNELIAQIERALSLHGSASALRKAQYDESSWRAHIPTQSPPIADPLTRAQRAAQSAAPVLIPSVNGTRPEIR